MNKLTREDIVRIANETLAFVQERVGNHASVVNVILDEAKHQDEIERRLFAFENRVTDPGIEPAFTFENRTLPGLPSE